jgi:hypothetical protein
MLRKPGGDREMVDILSLVLQHDEQAVLVAVELALSEGVPTKTHVLNLLHRLVDGKVGGAAVGYATGAGPAPRTQGQCRAL